MTTVIPPIFVCSNWGDEVRLEEEMADAKFVSMKRPEWEEEKRRAKTSKKFRSWDDWLAWASRIDDKRRVSRQTSKPVAQSALSSLLELRREYINTPAMHFYTVESQQREIRKLEKEILSCVGGADALNRAKMYDPIEEEVEVETDNESVDSDDVDLAVFARRMVRA